MGADYKLIGNRIKIARKKRGLTQEDLAELLDVSIGYVSQVERGVTKISLDLLASVSVILRCDVSELVAESAVESNGYIAEDLARRISELDGRQKKMLYEFLELLEKW